LTLNPNGTGLYYLTYPIGISILKGDYDLAGTSSTVPLVIHDPNQIRFVPAIPVIKSFDFKPSSDLATFVAADPNALKPADLRVTGTVSTAGYRGTGTAGPDTGFQNFPPGIYTVVGADLWGSVAILHFTVT
jgi:hypothetical protein